MSVAVAAHQHPPVSSLTAKQQRTPGGATSYEQSKPGSGFDQSQGLTKLAKLLGENLSSVSVDLVVVMVKKVMSTD